MNSKIDLKDLPNHIAIIMDGNGRWAKKRFLPRTMGHREGKKTVKKIIEYAASINIKELSLFSFGRENWKRPKKEVDTLLNLLADSLENESENLHKNNIKVNIIGDKTRFNKSLLEKIFNIQNLTINNSGMKLNIMIDYSGQWDILNIIKSLKFEEIENLDEEKLSNKFKKNSVGNIDLLIRTSGEKRISNFALWQLSYTELYFTNKLWPDFDINEFNKSIEDFLLRKRRFGKIN